MNRVGLWDKTNCPHVGPETTNWSFSKGSLTEFKRVQGKTRKTPNG